MKPFDQMAYHPTAEKLVSILCNKTQNPNPQFFRVMVGYSFAVMASAMRCKIKTHGRDLIPVNIYALNLGTSGSGKGHSTNIMQKKVMYRFRQRFLDETFEALAEVNLPKLATRRANKKGTSPDDELEAVKREFSGLGPLFFSFDSATPAAVKQMRHKLLMADAGALNLEIDEIGSNLLGQVDVLNTFLELYDVGEIKPKLVKNTSENLRVEEIHGNTPTNMMLFGTPAKLLDGAKTEEEFYSMLETGYARRCIFGNSPSVRRLKKLTPEEVYAMQTSKESDEYLEQLAARFDNLADMVNINRILTISKETMLELIEYELMCKEIAEALPEHAQIKKAEITHRYFKALKLAGAYAFVDDSPEVTQEHLYNAIRLVEDSGVQFDQILNRERAHIKLAKYLGTTEHELTHSDLMEDLPFYKGSAAARSEMVSLATAWGYKNGIIIKKAFSDGIEFLRGEALKQTDLSKMIFALSTDITEGYDNVTKPWDKLYKLTQAPGLHWTSHHLVGGYRNEDNAIPGFNLIVLDCDEGTTLDMVRSVFKDYKYLIYTTKRHRTHDAAGNYLGDRFRVILPANYTLKMDGPEFKEFMKNIYETLPFKVDESTGQRARKWMSHSGNEESPGHYEYNEGALFDVLPYIPKTTKNEERVNRLKDQSQMDALQRWVMNNIGDGNRNNMLLRYAMIMVDANKSLEEIQSNVMDLNSKIADKLSDEEIFKTIFITVSKAVAKRSSN